METTKQMLADLHTTLVNAYEAELKKLPFKKSVRETLIDGFRDGARSGIHHTVQMLGVTIKE